MLDDVVVELSGLKASRSLLSRHASRVTALEFIDDRILASGFEDGHLKYWSLQTGECIRDIQAHSHSIDQLIRFKYKQNVTKFAPEPSILSRIFCCDCLTALFNKPSLISSTQFLISSSRDGKIKFWSTQNGSCLKTISYGGSGPIHLVPHTGEGFLAAGSYGQLIKVYDVVSGRCLLTLDESLNHRPVSFNKTDTFLATCGAGERIFLWDLKTGARCFNSFIFQSTFSSLTLADGRLVAFNKRADYFNNNGSLDSYFHSVIELWRIENAECLSNTAYCRGEITSLTLLSVLDKQLVIAALNKDCRINVWDLASGDLIKSFVFTDGLVTKITSEHDTLVIGLADGSIKIIDSFSKQIYSSIVSLSDNVKILEPASEKRFGNPFVQISAFTLTPDLNYVISGNVFGDIQVWNIEKAAVEMSLLGHKSKVKSLAFHSRYLVSASGDSVRVWDLTSGECVRILIEFDEYCEKIALVMVSDDIEAPLLAIEIGKAVKVYDLDSGLCLKHMNTRVDGLGLLGMGKDNHLVRYIVEYKQGDDKRKSVSSSDCEISAEVRNTETGESINRVRLDLRWIESFAVLKHKNWLISGGESRQDEYVIKIHSMTTRDLIRVFNGHLNRISGLTIQDEFLISVSRDNTIRFWSLSGDEIGILFGHDSGHKCDMKPVNSDSLLLATMQTNNNKEDYSFRVKRINYIN